MAYAGPGITFVLLEITRLEGLAEEDARLVAAAQEALDSCSATQAETTRHLEGMRAMLRFLQS